MNQEIAVSADRSRVFELKPVGILTLDSHIKNFNRWARLYNKDENGKPSEITALTIKDFFEHLLRDKNKYGRKNRASTLQGYKSAIKKSVGKTFKMTTEEKVAFELFFKKIKLPKIAKNIKSIDEDELKELIEKSEERTSLILRFLVMTGLRISEMINIKVSDVILSSDKSTYEIYVVGKGNKEGYVRGISLDLIYEVQRVFKGTEYLFEREKMPKRPNQNKSNPMKYTRRQMYVLIEKAGLEVLGKRINPHMTRHTCGRILMDKLKDVNKVQDMLRHSSVRTTIENYLNTKITSRDVQDAFKGILY